MPKIIKSMREDLKSMHKVFQVNAPKFLKSMRKVNARKFKIDAQGHCSKFKSNGQNEFLGSSEFSSFRMSDDFAFQFAH